VLTGNRRLGPGIRRRAGAGVGPWGWRVHPGWRQCLALRVSCSRGCGARNQSGAHWGGGAGGEGPLALPAQRWVGLCVSGKGRGR